MDPGHTLREVEGGKARAWVPHSCTYTLRKTQHVGTIPGMDGRFSVACLMCRSQYQISSQDVGTVLLPSVSVQD